MKRRYCKRCGCRVKKEKERQLKKEYPFYCPCCDENMYRFETDKNNAGKCQKAKGEDI